MVALGKHIGPVQSNLEVDADMDHFWNSFVKLLGYLQIFTMPGSAFWSLSILAVGVYQLYWTFAVEKGIIVSSALFVLTCAMKMTVKINLVLIPQV